MTQEYKEITVDNFEEVLKYNGFEDKDVGNFKEFIKVPEGIIISIKIDYHNFVSNKTTFSSDNFDTFIKILSNFIELKLLPKKIEFDFKKHLIKCSKNTYPYFIIRLGVIIDEDVFQLTLEESLFERSHPYKANKSNAEIAIQINELIHKLERAE